jgi:uncharacterized protein (TIGR00266 family)
MADEIEYKIFGDAIQVVEITLDPQETVRAETGAMLYMEDGIEMQTGIGSEGIFSGFKRIVTGDSFFITSFVNTNVNAKKHVAFAAPYPGKIIPMDLKLLGGEMLCQKDGFLCAAKGIEIEIAFTKKIGNGFFGGEGFILQRLTGDGLAFVYAGGAIIERVLADGESISIDTGCLVAMQPSVNFDVQFIGGFKNALFGGEGLFLAKLTGPGKIYLQSIPFSRMVDRIVVASSRYGGKEERA